MVTAFYAGILGFLYFLISLETIKARRRNRVSLGTGKEDQIAPIVSAHANFAAYVSLLLVLMFFVENSNLFPVIFLHLIGMAVVLGRTCHFVAFRSEKMNFKLRVFGMHLTLWPMVLLSVANVGIFLYLNIAG